MTNLKKLLESEDARLDKAYDLALKVINGDPGFIQVDSDKVPYGGALITELDGGSGSREQRFYKFKDRYLVGTQKFKGQDVENNKPFGYVKIIKKFQGNAM